MIRRGRPPYRLLSLLLQYPDDELLAARDGIAAFAAGLPRSYERECIQAFLPFWLETPHTSLRQVYVETFDLQRRCGLYLSYYAHGDTRKRGQSLLRLKTLYRSAGLVLDSAELPDYLPLMLEFAELATDGRGEHVLREHRVALELLRRALRDRESPYADLLDAVCHRLPRLNPLQTADLGRLAAEGPPSEQVGLQPFAPPEVMPAELTR